MAILNMKEFSTLVGLSYDTVKKNAQRGNIVKGTNGKIDTENAINKLFIDEKTATKSINPTKYKKDTEEKTSTKKRIVSEEPTGLTKVQKEYADLELRKKIAETNVKERESELKKMELERKAGNYLPVDLVSSVMSRVIYSILKTFDSDIENLARIYTERFGGDRKDLSEIIKKQREMLSKSIEKAKDNSILELNNAISEFQDIKK